MVRILHFITILIIISPSLPVLILANAKLKAMARRFTKLAEAEGWVKTGEMRIVSDSLGMNNLTGVAVSSSGGHPSVLVGFDAYGNPSINDLAAPATPRGNRPTCEPNPNPSGCKPPLERFILDLPTKLACSLR